MTTQKQIEKEEAIKELKPLIAKGRYVIYTVLRHVSSSGLSRRISCFVIIKNEPYCIDHLISKMGLYKRDLKTWDGLKVSGCGMDMGFDVVYNTSAQLYGYTHEGGYKIKQKWL